MSFTEYEYFAAIFRKSFMLDIRRGNFIFAKMDFKTDSHMVSLEYRRNVGKFLDTLSSEALTYLFPGAEREEIEDAFGLNETDETNYYRYLTSDTSNRRLGGGMTSFMQALTVKPRTQEPEDEDVDVDILPGVVSNSKSAHSQGGDVTDDSYLEMDMEESARNELINICMNESSMTDKELRDAVKKWAATLRMSNRLSRLHITRDGEFFLEGAVNAKLKLDTLSKTFYILYLNHSDGINYKDFGDYEKELKEIYTLLSHRSDMEGMMESLKRMYDPDCDIEYKNQYSSRIKKAFDKVMSPIIAKNYYVSGKRGETRTIKLPRNLVIDDFSCRYK